MYEIKLNTVKECNSFKEFLDIIKGYDQKVAFISKEKSYTYLDLYQAIVNVISSIKDRRKYYVLNIQDPYLFTVGFFSIILSNNIAYLIDPKLIENIEVEHTIIDDDLIKNMISSIGNETIQDADINDCSVIALSSGTTSYSKEVMLSSKNLLTDTRSGMQLYQYDENARYLHIIPYTHLFGLVADLLGPLLSGATICYGKQIDFYHNLEYFKITNLNLPPKMVEILYQLIQSNPSNNLCIDKILCAGAKLDSKYVNLFKEYNIKVYTAYGLTECSPCVSISHDGTYRKDSAGMIMPCCKVKIIDEEILVKGDNVMLGYLNTNASIIDEDGYLHTGDLGYVEENYLYITGRKNNLIVFDDGTKIDPEVLESMINQIEGVEESLVKEVNEKLDITIVSNIKVSLDNIISQYNLYGKINNIHYSKSKLERTNLGKLIRK